MIAIADKDSPRTGLLGMWFAMAAILMLFTGLTSAYVVRRGLDPQWQAIHMPALGWVGAAVLLISSIMLEIGRRSLLLAARWFLSTWMLGMLFLICQLIVWRQLATAGLYLSTNSHSSFFYLLSALHGLHLLGGLAALTWLLWKPGRSTAVLALYWHFMGGLWIYLLVILFGI